MKICRPNNGSPPKAEDVVEMPSALGNISPAKLDDWVAAGWREYAPSATENIRSSLWVDDGTQYREVVTEAWSAQDLAQKESDRQAAYAAEAAAFRTLQSELDNAQLITKGMALTILDELNRITSRMRDFDAAVQAATSLADLKTRVGGLLPIPERTVAQLKAAVKAKVDGLP